MDGPINFITYPKYPQVQTTKQNDNNSFTLGKLHIRHVHITKTCPCNEYPLIPHNYIAKLGYAGVYLFFLFLLQNIDCGYSLEPPRVPTIYVLSKNKKNIEIFLLKIFIFYFKNPCILHGHVSLLVLQI